MTTISANLTTLLKDWQTSKKDHESRIRRLELWGFIGMGIMYTIMFFRSTILGKLGIN